MRTLSGGALADEGEVFRGEVFRRRLPNLVDGESFEFFQLPVAEIGRVAGDHAAADVGGNFMQRTQLAEMFGQLLSLLSLCFCSGDSSGSNCLKFPAEGALESAEFARRSGGGDGLGDILGSVAKQTTRTIGTTVGREIGRTVVRGLLGGLFGKR